MQNGFVLGVAPDVIVKLVPAAFAVIPKVVRFEL